MARLEELQAGAQIRGLAPEGLAWVVGVEWFGDQALKLTFEDAAFFVVLPGQEVGA
jgi:hypothetical protein